MNGEADNSRFVSMYVYMHLAFQKISCSYFDRDCVKNATEVIHLRISFPDSRRLYVSLGTWLEPAKRMRSCLRVRPNYNPHNVIIFVTK